MSEAAAVQQDGAGRPIRGAIFDLGGVMTYSVFGRPRDVDPELLAMAAFFLQELHEVYALPTGAHDLHRLETGRLSEADFFTRLCERYAAAGHRRLDPEEVRRTVFSRKLTACAAMVDAVRQVKAAGYRTALLTNNAREWESAWRSLVPVDELFDTVIDSSVVGLRKPDPEIYRLTCERLGLDAEECFFVDDLECNIDAAAQLGMKTLLCVGPEQAADEVARRLLGRSVAIEDDR